MIIPSKNLTFSCRDGSCGRALNHYLRKRAGTRPAPTRDNDVVFGVQFTLYKDFLRYRARYGRLSMNMNNFSDKSLYPWQQTAKDWTEVQVFF
jgi:hypothetical protein